MDLNYAIPTPDLTELLENMFFIELPMNVKFRGITTRYMALLAGPAGWGEFAPFLDYSDLRATYWLNAAIEAAYLPFPAPHRPSVAVNATIPAVPAEQVKEISKQFEGATTAKVKVAEKGQTWEADLARIRAVAEIYPKLRIDVNGRWSVTTALKNLADIANIVQLEYVEQPCATITELAELRKRLAGQVLIAADESIRIARDPLTLMAKQAADIAILKLAPLGGVQALQKIATQISIPLVLSSALDSPLGLDQALIIASRLIDRDRACGLATERLFKNIYTEAKPLIDGKLSTEPRSFSPAALQAYKMTSADRAGMIARVRKTYYLWKKLRENNNSEN